MLPVNNEVILFSALFGGYTALFQLVCVLKRHSKHRRRQYK